MRACAKRVQGTVGSNNGTMGLACGYEREFDALGARDTGGQKLS